MKGLCKCGHDDHFDHGHHACSNTSCMCHQFRAAPTPQEEEAIQAKAQADLKRYTTQYKSTKERIRYVLEHTTHLRDFSAQNFVNWYRNNVDPDAYFETIRRSKQKLVEENPKLYGPQEAETIRQQRIKAEATQQWSQQ